MSGLKDLDLDGRHRRVAHGGCDGGVGVAPRDEGAQVIGCDVVRRDPDAQAHRGEGSRDVLAQTEHAALIDLALDRGLERREVHAGLCRAHGDDGGGARGDRRTEQPGGSRRARTAAHRRRHVGERALTRRTGHLEPQPFHQACCRGNALRVRLRRLGGHDLADPLQRIADARGAHVVLHEVGDPRLADRMSCFRIPLVLADWHSRQTLLMRSVRPAPARGLRSGRRHPPGRQTAGPCRRRCPVGCAPPA